MRTKGNSCYCDTRIMERTKDKITMNPTGLQKSPPFESTEKLETHHSMESIKVMQSFLRK